MAPNVGLRIQWMFSYSLSYSQFGLQFLSYYCFEYYLSAHSGLLLIWFKISINGHVSSHGLQFPVTPDDSGGLFFKLSSLFWSHCCQNIWHRHRHFSGIVALVALLRLWQKPISLYNRNTYFGRAWHKGQTLDVYQGQTTHQTLADSDVAYTPHHCPNAGLQ